MVWLNPSAEVSKYYSFHFVTGTKCIASHVYLYIRVNHFVMMIWHFKNNQGLIPCKYLYSKDSALRHFRGVPIYAYIVRSDTAKTCRPKWDAADHSISSGSTLFVPVYLN